MKLVHNNILIVTLMLVSFIGQAMANTALSYSAVLCVHSSMNKNMSMMTHDDMDDEAVSNTVNYKSQTPVMDCCQEDCKCPMNGCVSLSLLFNNNFNSELIAEQKIFQLFSSHKSQTNSSLYRPPIS